MCGTPLSSLSSDHSTEANELEWVTRARVRNPSKNHASLDQRRRRSVAIERHRRTCAKQVTSLFPKSGRDLSHEERASAWDNRIPKPFRPLDRSNVEMCRDKKLPKGVRTDRHLRECWAKMRVLLARKFGKSLPFVGALEFHKSGVAHLHLLVGQYISQKLLSRAWQSIGGGKIVDIRYVDVHRVSAYLSVYLAGDKVSATLELLPTRARIFTTARSIVLWGKKIKSGWWLRRLTLTELLEAVESASNVRFQAVEDLKP